MVSVNVWLLNKKTQGVIALGFCFFTQQLLKYVKT